VRVLQREQKPRETARLVLDNILFATDFSLASEVGLQYALALARHYHARLSIVAAARMDSVDAIANHARESALQQSRARAFGW
jgi:nucleotide-binding universal stress UspA family protein